MKSEPNPKQPLPLIPPGLSDEEFRRWLQADPRNQAAFDALAQMVADTDPAQVPPEMRGLSESLLAKRREHLALEQVTTRMQALMKLMQQPGGTMVAEERLAQLNRLMDEVTDALLETPEPHRTRFLKELLPLREQVRQLKVEED